MKATILVLTVLLSTLLGLTIAEQEMIEETAYESEFLKGMEKGFFLRNSDNGHREFECPDPKSNEEFMKKLNS